MAKTAAQIVIKRERGRLIIQTIGRTPRGQKYIKEQQVLEAQKIGAPGFKEQVAAAVEELVGSETPGIQYGLDIPETGG